MYRVGEIMSKKIYTINEIIDYNICPRKYMLIHVLGLECTNKGFKDQINEKYNDYAYNAIVKSFYYLFMKMKKQDDPIHIDQFKKQFGNIYYKDLSAIDIIGMETRSPGDLEPLFTSSLNCAIETFYALNTTKWKPLIIDKEVQVEIGDFVVVDKIDAILENKNGTNSIEIMKFSKSKMKNIDDMFVKNNFHLNFGRHMLRSILDAQENRISIVYPYKAHRQVISKPDDEYYKRFLDITKHTCENIQKEYYPAFVNKFKCDGCAYKAVCDNYRERI